MCAARRVGQPAGRGVKRRTAGHARGRRFTRAAGTKSSATSAALAGQKAAEVVGEELAVEVSGLVLIPRFNPADGRRSGQPLRRARPWSKVRNVRRLSTLPRRCAVSFRTAPAEPEPPRHPLPLPHGSPGGAPRAVRGLVQPRGGQRRGFLRGAQRAPRAGILRKRTNPARAGQQAKDGGAALRVNRRDLNIVQHDV